MNMDVDKTVTLIAPELLLDVVDKKSNVIGAALRIFLEEVVTGVEMREAMRRVTSGSQAFWETNRDEIRPLVARLHEMAGTTERFKTTDAA